MATALKADQRSLAARKGTSAGVFEIHHAEPAIALFRTRTLALAFVAWTRAMNTIAENFAARSSTVVGIHACRSEAGGFSIQVWSSAKEKHSDVRSQKWNSDLGRDIQAPLSHTFDTLSFFTLRLFIILVEFSRFVGYMARGQKRLSADDSASKSRRLFPLILSPDVLRTPLLHLGNRHPSISSLINGGAVSPAAPRGATLKGKNGHPRTDVSAPRSLPPASDRQSGTSTLTRAATFRAGISLELFPLGQSSTSHGASTSRLVPDPNRPTFLPPPRDAALNDLSRAVQKKKAAPRGPLFAESSFPAVRAAPRTELTALRWDLDHAPRPPASARSSSSMAGPTPALNSRTWPDSTTAEPGRQRAAARVRVPRRQTANALETSTSRPVTHRPRSAAHPYRADGHRASRAFSPLLLPVSASTPADDAIESWDDELEEMNTRLDDVLSPPFAPASPRPYPTAAPSRPSASTRAEDDAIGYFEDEMDEMERRLYDVLSSPSPEPTMARPLPRSPSRSSVRQG
ncbi:hypothetical protein B0H16DRAFT_1739515, partial [Mycena metata]